MKTIIAGSVIEENAEITEAVQLSDFEITEVVSPAASSSAKDGLNKLVERWARENGVPFRFCPEDWYGPARPNDQTTRRLQRIDLMVEYADALIAIWNGRAGHTRRLIRWSRQRGLDFYSWKAGLGAEVLGELDDSRLDEPSWEETNL